MEMELTSSTQDGEPIEAPGGVRAVFDETRSPIENPAIDPIPDDPLLEPHPGEPGVHSDGTAAPLENPDDAASADPLVSSG
jgi:hypothetical protein